MKELVFAAFLIAPTTTNHHGVADFSAFGPVEKVVMGGTEPKKAMKVCPCSPNCTCGCNQGQECDCRQWVSPVTSQVWQPFQHNPGLYRQPMLFAPLYTPVPQPRMMLPLRPMWSGGPALNCGPSG